MTRKTRAIIFLFLLILFLIAAPLAIFYCLGWRFDWKTKKVFQPGIFYFKVLPKNAEIYLDGKLKKKTDFFFSSALIENLLPKKYDIEIKKEGFYDWKKTLEIKERQATEAKNIVLVPKNPDFKEITKGVKDFLFSPDEKKIILKEEELSSGKIIWALKLFEIDKNVKSQLINEEDILARRSPKGEGGSKENADPVRDSEAKEKAQREQISNGAELLNLKFSPDSKKILLEIGLKERVNYYLLEIDKTPPVLTSLGSLEKPEEFFLPSPLKKEAIALTISDDDVYYLDDSGFLFKNEIKLNLIPHEIKKETKYEITASGSNILLQEDNILYIFDENTKSFQKLSHIKNFRFSPDSQKLAYFTDYEIWVLFLEKNYNQPEKEKGEKLFITRFSEEIDNIFWYTDYYLIFNTRDKIKIVELDDRDKINIYDLAELPEPKIFWNQNDKKLYILSEGNLYASEKLVP